METRSHIHEESFDIAPEAMFDMLITPSAIRGWWGASKAIVIPEEDGLWTASWGDEDDPDYVSTATLVEFDPPRKLAMKYGNYYARTGPLPFEFAENALTTFTIEPNGGGCTLRVEQTGFPCDPIADDHYAACEIGWKNTFEMVRVYWQYMHPNPPEEEPEMDPHLTPEEEFRVSKLTAAELQEIDNALMSDASPRERKVARIVGTAIGNLKPKFKGIPDIFFARRVRKLIGEGKLIVDGNPDYMRFSEVRLPENNNNNE